MNPPLDNHVCEYDHADDDEPTAEQAVKIRRYYLALRELAEEDARFRSNYNTFARWYQKNEWRLNLWWIGIVEQQAEKGLDTIGVHVVVRVVSNRMD